jgi:hypothetical protein
VRVFVLLFESGRVGVRVCVGLTVVGVLVLVLHVIVLVGVVGVAMALVAVVVLVLVNAVVAVILSRHFVFSLVDRRFLKVLDVAKRFVEQHRHMWVKQGIDGVAALPSAYHQTQITQDPQLMRHRGLGHLDGLDDLAHRGGTLTKMAQHPHPTRRRQRPHDPGHLPCYLYRY